MFPEGRQAVGDIGTDEDLCTSRDMIAIDLIISDDSARCHPRWRIEAQCFLNDHAQICEPGEILIRWIAPTEDCVKFLIESMFYLRMMCKDIPSPGQRIRSSVVPTKEYGSYFVIELLIIHTLAGLSILCSEQHRDKISAIVRCILAAFLDNAVYESIE